MLKGMLYITFFGNAVSMARSLNRGVDTIGSQDDILCKGDSEFGRGVRDVRALSAMWVPSLAA